MKQYGKIKSMKETLMTMNLIKRAFGPEIMCAIATTYSPWHLPARHQFSSLYPFFCRLDALIQQPLPLLQ